MDYAQDVSKLVHRRRLGRNLGETPPVEESGVHGNGDLLALKAAGDDALYGDLQIRHDLKVAVPVLRAVVGATGGATVSPEVTNQA